MVTPNRAEIVDLPNSPPLRVLLEQSVTRSPDRSALESYLNLMGSSECAHETADEAEDTHASLTRRTYRCIVPI